MNIIQLIDSYLERADMFVLEDNGVKAVCVVTDEGKYSQMVVGTGDVPGSTKVVVLNTPTGSKTFSPTTTTIK